MPSRTASTSSTPRRCIRCRRAPGLRGAPKSIWVTGSRNQARDKLIIATKITGPARGFDWIRGGPRVTAAQIAQAVETSLQRLQTDYIDLYQIHWPDRNVPMFGQSAYDPEAERDATLIADNSPRSRR